MPRGIARICNAATGTKTRFHVLYSAQRLTRHQRPSLDVRVTDANLSGLIVEEIDQRNAELANAGVALFPPEPAHWSTRRFVAKTPMETALRLSKRLRPNPPRVAPICQAELNFLLACWPSNC